MLIHDYEKSLMSYDEYVVHKHILLIFPPILLTVGSIGNIFSFIILLKNIRKTSTYSYLCALALVDLLVLYVGLLRIWIGQFTSDFVDINNVLCKIGIFLGYVCSDVSVWLIVAVTVERFIAVMFPLKAPRVCNTRNARITILCIIVLFISVNSHFLWSVQLHHYSFNNITISKCHAKPLSAHLVEEVWPWVDAAIYSFVPFLIIIILNIYIIKRIVSARQNRNVLRQQSSLRHKYRVIKPNRTHEEASRRITFMLLVVSFSFLITTLPMNIVLIVTSFYGTDEFEDDAIFSKRKLMSTSTEMLMYLNHSINFFLYCVTGKKFRRQFKELIMCGNTSIFSHRIAGNFQGYSLTTTVSFRQSMHASRPGFTEGNHNEYNCSRV